MKKIIMIAAPAILFVAISAMAAFAQCSAKQVSLSGGAASVSGKTGGCNRFSFVISEGQRVKASLTSTDGKARFELQDGAEDETGSEVYSGLTTFNRVLTFTDFSIEVAGTASTSFTLKVTVTDE